MQSVWVGIRKKRERDNLYTDKGLKGYYLCTNDKRYLIGTNFSKAKANFDKACDKFLTANTGWRYDVEYCHGANHAGVIGWGNMDVSESFIE